ncbi:hypothetical protein D3C81_1450070 [compost metagenome]
MPGIVGKAGLGQVDVPIALVDQVVGVAKTQGVVGFAKRHGLLAGGAQLAQHRVVARRQQQLAQIACGRHVVGRQTGGLHVPGVGHAQCLGLGVHRFDESVVAPWIVVRQG